MKKKLLLFVICLMTFSFANAQINSLAIVGDGAGGWPTGAVGEVDAHQMSTADGGLHWTINNLALSSGAVKFRANNEWNPITNWGGTTFPSGTGIADGAAMTSVSGIYNVTFNTNTLAYTFVLQKVTFQTISIIGDAAPGGWVDTDMTTTDGIIYTLKRVSLVPGGLKFRGDHSWTLPYNWGGTNFPSGTSVVDAAPITIPNAGYYNISFNKNTLVYSFAFQVISIFGDSTPGGWSTDTDMTTVDGNNYTLANVSLIPGALKFRGGHSWTLPYNWGGTAFPSGTAVVDANGITIPTAGNYNINFNVSTATYSFTNSLSIKGFNLSKLSVYPNPANVNWNVSSSNENIESIQIIDVLGKKIRTSSSNSKSITVDASSLKSGIYFAKIATATGTDTIKLIKN
ncbi:T9SS type A sorting domain-containing protein [Flavobacterium cellulosilyticum]|uniref:T9SS type A sorting domain-containing protein n=1 Tax=Flavobacterium cellulosilyticum TaxID=2541731 RepID=A0A4R5C8Z7_9FLAO|nr:T9SS type A sorting domain-containing protein [Flavobacterium cellulosilyticum]TDD93554.1 T9SS type A sorting domain-containing protein [Flavobacterium cellulosilyticum]